MITKTILVMQLVFFTAAGISYGELHKRLAKRDAIATVASQLTLEQLVNIDTRNI